MYNLVTITKLGREIIEILIISMVQTHKLPYSARNNQNFNLFPQKVVFKANFTLIWGAIGEISPISTKFTYFFTIILLHKSAGLCNTRGSKIYIIKN